MRSGDNRIPADRQVTHATPRRAPEPRFPRISQDRVEQLLRGGPAREAGDG